MKWTWLISPPLPFPAVPKPPLQAYEWKSPTFAEMMLKADDDMAEYRRLKAERDMDRGYEG